MIAVISGFCLCSCGANWGSLKDWAGSLKRLAGQDEWYNSLLRGEKAHRHPRPCGPGFDPLRVSPLPVLGPLSLLPPPPVSCCRMILPASEKRANIVQVSAVSRHRSRNVGHGHGFCIFTAPSLPALWQLPSGKASWLRHHARARRSGLPNSSASFAPARSAPERITPRRCRLIVTAWGWHRFSPSSPAVVHLCFAPITSSVCASDHPCPRNGATGNEEPTKNLIGTLPPAPSRHPMREREQAACLQKCSALSVGVILPGAYCPGPDHASLLPAVRYCKEKQPPRPKCRTR